MQPTFLTILYWLLIVLSAVGVFAPPAWTYAPRVGGISTLVLFVIVGLRIFRMPIQ